MKRIVIALALVAAASPAYAQLGGLSGVLKKAQELEGQKQKLDELTVNEEEERRIGEDVSAKVRARFGVVQDPAVHKYVSLVGLTLARATERPNLAWTFIVLDTDGVNAFASPGGFVHITRGALGLIRNEGELATVLGHEIGHVVRKHTVNAIRKSRAIQFGTSETLADRNQMVEKIANKAYEMVLENAFDRGDEMDADRYSVQLARKVGYAPATLADFLARLDERNRSQSERNGLFASHPETKERIDTIRGLAAGSHGALVEARYKANVSYQPTSIASIAVVPEGSAGLTGGGEKKATGGTEKKAEASKKGFGLGVLTQTVAPEKNSAQVSASGGARGLGPDRLAKGGSNPSLVKTTVSAAELDQFRKGIA